MKRFLPLFLAYFAKKIAEKFASLEKSRTFASLSKNKAFLKKFGKVVEWSITAVLKTAVLRGTGGSNPSLSADILRLQPMKTNREAILQHALQLFMSMNYERVSLQMITKAVGLSKTGIFNYYPTKQDLFIAVIDKYLFHAQNPENKYGLTHASLADFLENYVQGVRRTMEEIVALGSLQKETMRVESANAGYFHLFQQALFYYPNAQAKLREVFDSEYHLWHSVLGQAREQGEIKPDTNVEEATALFRQVFVGLSYEMSFFEGLNVEILQKRFQYIYSLLKA